MDWNEFTVLLAGILPETPLGQIVQIRSETDSDIIKHFTPRQKEIRSEWRRRMQPTGDINSLQALLSEAFGAKE